MPGLRDCGKLKRGLSGPGNLYNSVMREVRAPGMLRCFASGWSDSSARQDANNVTAKHHFHWELNIYYLILHNAFLLDDGHAA